MGYTIYQRETGAVNGLLLFLIIKVICVRDDVIVGPKVFLGHVECCLLPLYERPY